MSNSIIKALIPVLTQAEKDECVTKAHDRDGAPCLYELADCVEQAVRAKLAEQKPIAYIYDDEVYGNDSGAISDYIREHGTPLYAHPTPTK